MSNGTRSSGTAPLSVMAAGTATLIASGFGLIPEATSPGIMQIVVTAIVLAAGLYVILSNKYNNSVVNWAFGMVGTIVGYWLPR